MLNNLMAELVRKRLNPVKAIVKTLNCSEKTARNKLNGATDFTVPEAVKLIDEYFSNDSIDIFNLFSDTA